MRRPPSPARLASGPGPARLALALGALALLAVAPSPAAAKAKPIVALAPVEVLLDGRRELVGVAVGPDGTVYVSDRKAGVVWRLAPGERPSVAVRGLRRPAGLALDGAARLLIAEQQTGRVLRLEASGPLTVLAAGLTRPRWLAAAPDGTLYVTADRLRRPADRDEDDEDDEDAEDDGPRIIVRRDPGTGALRVVASGLRQLQGVAMNGHTLYAALKRVVGLAPVNGAVARFPLLPGGALGAPSYLLSAGLERPVGLALDRLGALYVTAPEVGPRGHTAKDAVGKIHPDGHLTEFARELEDPQGAALGSDGSLYVADGDRGRLIRFRAPPAPAFTHLPEFTKQSSLIVTGTAPAHARVDVFVNDATTPTSVTATGGGTFTVTVPLAPNAANTLEAFATAPGGLTSAPAEATVTHDDILPELVFQAPPALAHVRQLVAIQAEATDGGSGIAQLDLRAGAATLTATLVPIAPAPTVTASATWDTTTVGAGAVGLTATATDRAGNTATLSRSVIVDNTPPVITLTGGPAEGEVTAASVTFAFTVSDNFTDPADLVVTLRLDGVLLSRSTSPVTLPGLLAGPHTFTISARDRAGNEATLTRGFTVSVEPVIKSLDPPSGPIGTYVTITGINFEPGTTQANFNRLAPVLRTITPTRITTTVPIGATTGPLTVTTSRGSASHTFTVTTTGDFTLTAAPTTVRAIAGDQTSVNIAAGGSGSFTSLVSLMVSMPPMGISANFSPSELVAPGASAFVNLALASTVGPGRYNFTVTGQAQVDGRTLTRMTAFTLDVLAPATTAITGRVLTAEAVPQPIPGATITLGSAFTLTDAGGNFVLLAPPADANMLLVDGRTASTPSAQYPPVEVNIAVNATGPTRVPFIVYLPKLDTANPVTLPLNAGGFTTQEVKASTPAIPGLVVTIPAGTRINGPDGTPVSQITITPVPTDRSPMPFPSGVIAPMLFTIQPGGAVPSQPLPITFPNIQNAPPGTAADLYFFDLIAGNWAVWGTGRVSDDGTQVVSDPGFGLSRFAWHFPWCRTAPPDDTRARHATGGEPVDLVTGRFTMSKTDFVLPGRMPVSLQRHYRNENGQPGLFGIGWNLDLYDSRLTTAGTSLSLILPDQSSYLLASTGPGRWENATEPFLRGAVLTQLPGDFRFQLRFKEGTLHRFERLLGFANAAALAAITDRNGNTVTIGRVPTPFQDHRITSLTEPAGRALAVAYDAAGRIASITDPIGRVVQYGYDALGRLSTVTDPAGGITRYTYDAQHRLLTITDPRNIAFLTNEYDAEGRVIRQTQADGGVWGFAYEVNGALVTATPVTDPRGNPTRYRFNALGYTLSQTDALGQTTVFGYAPGSNVLSSITDPTGRIVRFEHDTVGNVQRIVDPLGNAHALTYEATFGRLTSMRTPLGATSQFEYDSRGNVTAIVDTLGNRWAITYDTTGAPVRVTDPLGNSVTLAYDALGNLTGLTDPLGNTVTREYDGASRLLRETSPRGKTTSFAYDSLDRVTAVTDALGGTTRFTYDANGNLLTLTDPGGSVTAHTYDVMDRLSSKTDPLGRGSSYFYDGNGNLSQATDPKGQVAVFGYDTVNRRTRAAYADGTVVEFEYDAAGRLTRLVDGGEAIVHQHDTLGRIIREVTAQGAIEYGYDAWGRRVSMLADAGLFTYAYDGASRLRSVTLAGLGSAGLDYDSLGRVVRLALPNGTTTTYAYDALSRPVELVYENSAARLGELTYRYDANGNRTAVGGSPARTLVPEAVPGATYDAAHQQLAFGGRTMSYDANGNLVTLGDASGVTTFTYDAQDRLVQVDSAGNITRFAYDALGRRTARTADGLETSFQYDATDVIRDRTGGAEALYLRGLGQDQTFFRGQETGYLTDATNNTIALTDSAGTIAQTYSYEPFGRTEIAGATAINPYQYTGREREAGDLYYYRARYYHPRLGRFIQSDPLGLLAGPNPYAYAENNPINFLDPSGLRTFVAHGTSSGPGRLAKFSAALQKADPTTQVLKWSGYLTDTVPSTDVPATELFNKIMADLQANPLQPGEKLNLVGHSGGGIAFVKVAHMLRARGIKVSNLILLGTPLFPELVNPMLPPGVRVTNFIGLFDPLALPLLLPNVQNVFVLNALPNPVSGVLTGYRAHTGYAENQTVIRTIQDLIR